MGWTKDARVKGVNNSDAEKYAIDILRLSINFIIHILDITLFPSLSPLPSSPLLYTPLSSFSLSSSLSPPHKTIAAVVIPSTFSVSFGHFIHHLSKSSCCISTARGSNKHNHESRKKQTDTQTDTYKLN